MASETNFTPGPWAVQKAEDCMGRQLDDAVKWVVTSDEHDTWISTGPTWDPEHAEESEANARLIAAAPDLYAVVDELEESSSYWSEYCVPLGIVDRLRDALAKARGHA